MENPRDVTNQRKGIFKPADIRRHTANALVNTKAWTLTINEQIRAKLGLRVLYTEDVEGADGVIEKGSVTEAVIVRWKNRRTACTTFVLPNAPDVLFGEFAMKGMDLMVSAERDEVVGVHDDKTLLSFK
jgi:predicted aspartyl protease